MMRFQSRASVKYYQELLANSSKWLLTDAGGVVDTLTDGPGYTDILTTATSGAFYLTTPLVDASGAPVDAGSRFTQAHAWVRSISGSASIDEYQVGWSDNADPTAGGALWDVGGIQNNGGLWRPSEDDETAGSVGGSLANTDPYGYYPLLNMAGLSEQIAYVFMHDGTTFKSARGNTLAVRAFTPTHLMIRVSQNAAAIQTHRIAASFFVYPSGPAPSIESRA